jgi:hypothetical protein
MKIISHRGNLIGPCDLENHPTRIQELLNEKIECEIDVWSMNQKFYLGHDFAKYEVDFTFLQQSGLWCHAKNLDALNIMLDKKINCFWHQTDDFTLTSSGFIWTFPNKNITSKSIIVDTSPEWRNKNYDCYGVCADYIL